VSWNLNCLFDLFSSLTSEEGVDEFEETGVDEFEEIGVDELEDVSGELVEVELSLSDGLV
jgi:hypothetical protein